MDDYGRESIAGIGGDSLYCTRFFCLSFYSGPRRSLLCNAFLISTFLCLTKGLKIVSVLLG